MAAIDVTYKATVLSNYTICVRKGAGTNFEQTGTITGGTDLNITQLDGDWVKHDQGGGGWSILHDTDGTLLIRITDFGTDATAKDAGEKAMNPEQDQYDRYYQYQALADSAAYTSEETSSMFIKHARGIHGIPYQFMSSVDTRFETSEFGRKYAEKIITRMPLLLITPGRPKFMKGFTVKEKEDVFKYLSQKSSSPIDDLLNREGRFYDIEFNYKDYYDYVNPMCQMTARFLGIQDKVINGTKLQDFRWENWANSEFKYFASGLESVAFYIDSETQISESFSTSTGESALASKANGLSDMGREIQFLIGGTSGLEFDKLSQENYDSTLQEFNSFSQKYLKLVPQSIISKLTSGFLTIATGGKMIFPEIWNDSQFSKSYSINMKLVTPDYDNFSWFMNIAVPLLHLIALVAPQQMGPNAYKSPFVIKAFYKGFFNCDMGIITSMNITKGNQSKWTLNGLPTEVDINFDIKDLYQIMTITKQSEIIHLMNNTALLSYLANMCGVNINKPDLLRNLDIYMNQFVNSQGISGRAQGAFLSLDQMLSNKMNSMFTSIFK